ncbi:DNA polymerase III subunit gamma/tau [bacterium]|nr:DNA polymerase III subunit gamma/tau [bacterium]
MMSITSETEFLASARKWRPLKFDDLVGQSHVTTTLKYVIIKNRIAHAYLFTGSRGVGKTSLARIFSMALNCVNGPTIEPCGQCTMCEEIIYGNCMDVIEIDGASNNSVEDVRELRDSIMFVPAHAKYKIYIIDEVHMLSTSAFNALLKTLEEPPAHAVFIFATTEAHKVPATILSRCQRYDFRLISQAIITSRLKEIAQNDGISVDDPALRTIARAGNGSMRDAQSMFDQVVAFCGDVVSLEQVTQILGVYDRQIFFELISHAFHNRVAEGIQFLDQVIRDGKNVTYFVEQWLDHMRLLLLVRLLEEKTDVLECTEEEIIRLRAQAELYTPGELEFAVQMVAEAGVKMRYALSRQVVLELLFIKFCRLKSLISVDQALLKLEEMQKNGFPAVSVSNQPVVMQKISDEKNSSSHQPVQKQNDPVMKPVQTPSVLPQLPIEKQHAVIQPEPAAVAPVLEFTLENVRAVWREYGENATGAMVGHIQKLQLVSSDANAIRFTVAEKFYLDLVKPKLRELEELFSKRFGRKVAVKLELHNGENTAGGTTVHNETEHQKPDTENIRPEDAVLRHERIKDIIDTFNAKVISVRRKE